MFKRGKIWHLTPTSVTPQMSDNEKPLELKHILGLVAFLSVGMVIATLVFFMEMMTNRGMLYLYNN